MHQKWFDAEIIDILTRRTKSFEIGQNKEVLRNEKKME